MDEMHAGTWTEVAVLPNCDVCKQDGQETTAYVDGKTIFGPWAFMCRPHFDSHGVGLGIGRGQVLRLKESGQS